MRQLTPVRVSHRRTMLDRPRTVHWLRARRIKPHFLRLWLKTQAGFYIKEFVHGDFGRTTPNLGTMLGCECDILSLDVLSVDMQWPPPG